MNDDFLDTRPPLAKRDSSPIFKGEPVIIVHLAKEDGTAACSGVPFVQPPEYQGDRTRPLGYPLVLCPGCAIATGKFSSAGLVQG